MKNKERNKEVKGSKQNREAGRLPAKTKEFAVRFPLVWLSAAILIVYGQSLYFELTELDDSIFITEMAEYNKDVSNLAHSFTRGLFHPTNDIYYRPLFSDLMILNYQISGENFKGYHAINILLHLACTLLLFFLFRKLRIPQWQSFLLTLIFAIHPVLSQAVAWIPGRNDTLLALFTLGFLHYVISFSRAGKKKDLILQATLLLAAFFTKETAALAAPVAFFILILMEKKKLFEYRSMILYASWVSALALYTVVRMQATLKPGGMETNQMLTDFVSRLPVLIQYLGKFFLPINLNVFPAIEGTTYWYGGISLILVVALLLLSKKKNLYTILTGVIIFFLFLIPALIVPNTINSEVFEHRLYLPVIGLLLLVQQSVLFQNKLQPRQMIIGVAGICVALSTINFLHQRNFKDKFTFWEAAVRHSPDAAYANMMLGSRIYEKDSTRSWQLIHRAYALDSNMKFINYYKGQELINKDSILASEKFYLKELAINPEFASVYYPLARIAHFKNDVPAAIDYLEKHLAANPKDPSANVNLLLFFIDSNQKDKARQHVNKMQALHLTVPQEIMDKL